jgi:hypothetical protein
VLVLNNCTSLVEVHKSVAYLDKLVTLDLENCDCLSATNLKMVQNVTKHRATRASLVGVHKSDAYLDKAVTSNLESSIIYEDIRGSFTTIPLDSLINSNTLHKFYPQKINIFNTLKLVDVSQWRRFRSIGELPIGLQVTLDANANNATSLDRILIVSNWNQSQQLIYPGRSELLKKIPTRNPRKKLFKVSSLSSSLNELGFWTITHCS